MSKLRNIKDKRKKPRRKPAEWEGGDEDSFTYREARIRIISESERENLYNKFIYTILVCFTWILEEPKDQVEIVEKLKAINVKCIVKSTIKDVELITCPIVPAQNEKSINCLILADKGYFTDNSLPFSIAIFYEDIMSNHYEQNIELEFIEDNPRWIWVKSVGAPQLKNKGE